MVFLQFLSYLIKTILYWVFLLLLDEKVDNSNPLWPATVCLTCNSVINDHRGLYV